MALCCWCESIQRNNTIFFLISTPVLTNSWKGGLIRNGRIPRGLSKKTLAFFLKYVGVVTTQVPSARYRHSQGLVNWKFFVNLSLRQNLQWFKHINVTLCKWNSTFSSLFWKAKSTGHGTKKKKSFKITECNQPANEKPTVHFGSFFIDRSRHFIKKISWSHFLFIFLHLPVTDHMLHGKQSKNGLPSYSFMAAVFIQVIWAASWENLFISYSNNKDADQPSAQFDQHLCCLLPR